MTDLEDFKLPLAQNGQYPDNKRVRLRGSATGVYDLAPSGAEGWIRAHRHDVVGGYRMVFIEWDTDHWSYNAQPDMWTFEDHFELVNKEKMSVDKDDLRKALQVIAGALDESDEAPAPKKGKLKSVPRHVEEAPESQAEAEVHPSEDEFLSALRDAVRTARNAEGFIVFTVERGDLKGREVLIPRLFKATKTEEATVKLASFANHFGSIVLNEYVVDQFDGPPSDPDDIIA